MAQPSAVQPSAAQPSAAQAGHAAGCGVVLVSYGYNHGQPIRATPALAWVDALSDIPAALAAR